MKQSLLTAILICICFGPTLIVAAEVGVFSVMRREMDRSMSSLKFEEAQTPFFIAYTIRDKSWVTATATDGALMDSEQARYKNVRADVGVGDYDVNGFGWSRTNIPLDDDAAWHLARALWQNTDLAYKNAYRAFSSRKAELERGTDPIQVPDFSKEKAHHYRDAGEIKNVDPKKVEFLAKKLSKVFLGISHIQFSSVRVWDYAYQAHFLNSEGTVYTHTGSVSTIYIYASTQAEDGSFLNDYLSYAGENLSRFDDIRKIEQDIKKLVDRLERVRNAKPIDRYMGPVLFESAAVADMFAQNVSLSFLSKDGRRNKLIDRIGTRIMPTFVSVIDDPTIRAYQGHILAGYYPIDFQGVPARRTHLVDKGILKTLLIDRNPVEGIENSSGNRRERGVIPSNIFLESNKGVSKERLREQLLELAETQGLEYGIIIRKLTNPVMKRSLARPQTTGLRSLGLVCEAVRVNLDGSEELVSKVELSDFSGMFVHREFKNIVGVSSERSVFSIPSQVLSEAHPLAMASFVVPSLLFDDVFVQRHRGRLHKTPIVSHPLAQR